MRNRRFVLTLLAKFDESQKLQATGIRKPRIRVISLLSMKTESLRVKLTTVTSYVIKRWEIVKEKSIIYRRNVTHICDAIWSLVTWQFINILSISE